MLLTSDPKEAILRRDEKNYIMIKSNCSACKTCWVYLDHPSMAGKCIYGGPYSGYEKQEEQVKAPEKDKVS
jgi:MinD superfamily P-loop ATPase